MSATAPTGRSRQNERPHVAGWDGLRRRNSLSPLRAYAGVTPLKHGGDRVIGTAYHWKPYLLPTANAGQIYLTSACAGTRLGLQSRPPESSLGVSETLRLAFSSQTSWSANVNPWGMVSFSFAHSELRCHSNENGHRLYCWPGFGTSLKALSSRFTPEKLQPCAFGETP